MTPPHDFEHARLKRKQGEILDRFPDNLRLRTRRALSWLDRAEQCDAKDTDSTFIFLWISFNAAYASDIEEQVDDSERSVFEGYFKKLLEYDSRRLIYSAIWERFSSSIEEMMDNPYVFRPFWKFQNQEPGSENWEEKFESRKRILKMALDNKNTIVMLCSLFGRLYVLRNQMMHGGATWDGSVNRSQLRDGVEILGFLVPVFIELMMDNYGENWGKPYYPVIKRSSGDSNLSQAKD